MLICRRLPPQEKSVTPLEDISLGLSILDAQNPLQKNVLSVNAVAPSNTAREEEEEEQKRE